MEQLKWAFQQTKSAINLQGDLPMLLVHNRQLAIGQVVSVGRQEVREGSLAQI